MNLCKSRYYSSGGLQISPLGIWSCLKKPGRRGLCCAVVECMMYKKIIRLPSRAITNASAQYANNEKQSSKMRPIFLMEIDEVSLSYPAVRPVSTTCGR